MTRAAFFIALALGVAAASAQDAVKLKAGGTVTGDVVLENAAEVRVVTAAAETKAIPRDQVAEVRRGTPLDARVQKWLEGVDPADAGAVFAVAEKASKEKALALDAKRLARRVVALNPEHKEARALLGHVQALGAWHPDAAAARKAVATAMQEKGLVAWKDGFVKPADLAALKAIPGDWTLSDTLEWRRTDELKIEKGSFKWEGEWYEPAEKPLLAELELAKKRLDVSLHGAADGPCRVFAALDRKKTALLARRNRKVLDWFVAALDVKADEPMRRHSLDAFLFDKAATFDAFLLAYPERAGTDPVWLANNRAAGATPFVNFDGCAVHRERSTWENAIVGQLAQAMMYETWKGPALPDCIYVGIAQRAEMLVFDSCELTWSAAKLESRGPSALQVGTQPKLKAALMRMVKQGRAHMRELFELKIGKALSEDGEAFANMAVAFFLEKKRPEFAEFVRRAKGATLEERFQAAFGKPFEIVDEEFRIWIES